MKLGVGSLSKVIAAAVITLAMVAAGAVAVSQPAAAQAIEVRGNQRVDADTIRSYFRPGPGGRIDAARIDEALKALYATGLYEDVNISQSGGRLIVTVVENPTINRVAFEGNRKVNNDTLAGEVQSRQRGALSRPTVQADVQRIVEVYRRQGYYNVRVNPAVISQPNNRVDLVFEINEGTRTTVKKILFVGNEQYSDWRLLDVINTGTTNLLSFLNNKDVYDPERVSADQELLRRFYLKHGYADFRILSATVDLDPELDGFVITFHLDEGAQYRFGTIDVISNVRDADPEQFRGRLHTKSGAVYNAELVEKSIEDLTIELSRLGYAFAQVRPRGDRDFEGRLINIVFVIEEGARVYVERINVRGNTRTRDWVIRREFDLLEGDPYNRVLIDRAERRLKNLGYFEDVRITNEPGSAPDRVIVNVNVKEQLTGEFSIGGGYSTADGLIGEASIGERNFLGRGQRVRLAISYGERTRGGEFSFTEPYFLDTRIAAGFDIFARSNRRSSFNPVDIETVGGTLRAALPLTEELTFGLRYSAFQREIKLDDNLNDDDISLAFLQLAEQGKQLTSLVGYSLTYNQLDNVRDPTQGFYASLSQDFAGVGGDVKTIKTTAEARSYYPLGGDLVGMLKVQGGHIAGWGGYEMQILDHFFQGPNLVRGFAPSGIGPRDMTPGRGENALGGALYWGATAEVVFPFPFAPKEFGLRGALFADVGSLWDYKGQTLFSGHPPVDAADCDKGGVPTGSICLADENKIRSSVGASIIWASPFGPLRFDFAYAITKAEFDRTQVFRFGGGTRF